jgi:predicted acyl esterase
MTGNKVGFVATALMISAVTLACSGICLGAESYPIAYERDVKVLMRDGVVLRADIYRPQAEGKFPVLLQRTPYDKRNFAFGLKAASRGYVVIIQDVRGRYASEGAWYTFKNEMNDGYDTIEWAASLPYSLEFAPSLPRATTIRAGRTRAAPSNNGSTNLGLRV